MNARLTSLTTLAAAALLFATEVRPVQADQPESGADVSSARRSSELELGGYLGFATGDVCRRSASDVVDCERGSATLGPLLGMRWRFADHASCRSARSRARAKIGGFSSVSWEPGSGYDTLQWQLAAEARWLPFGLRSPGLWFGPDAGLVSLFDRVASNELASVGRSGGDGGSRACHRYTSRRCAMRTTVTRIAPSSIWYRRR